MTKLYATHGMIGSGKTTFSKKFCADNKILRFNHDDIMITLYGDNPPKEMFQEYVKGIDRLLESLTKNLLRNGQDVFLDLGLFEKKSRDFWRKIAKECEAEFIIYFIDCPKEIALQRTLQRTKEMPDGALRIDENAFNIINKRIEPLEENEKYIKINGA